MILFASRRYVVKAFNNDIFYSPKKALKIALHRLLTEQLELIDGIRMFYDISDWKYLIKFSFVSIS